MNSASDHGFEPGPTTSPIEYFQSLSDLVLAGYIVDLDREIQGYENASNERGLTREEHRAWIAQAAEKDAALREVKRRRTMAETTELPGARLARLDRFMRDAAHLLSEYACILPDTDCALQWDGRWSVAPVDDPNLIAIFVQRADAVYRAGQVSAALEVLPLRDVLAKLRGRVAACPAPEPEYHRDIPADSPLRLIHCPVVRHSGRVIHNAFGVIVARCDSAEVAETLVTLINAGADNILAAALLRPKLNRED